MFEYDYICKNVVYACIMWIMLNHSVRVLKSARTIRAGAIRARAVSADFFTKKVHREGSSPERGPEL